MKSDSKNNQIWVLLRPSGLSALISGITIVLIISISIISSILNNSTLNQLVYVVHNDTSTFATTYSSITSHLSKYNYLNTIVIYILWLGIGVIVYLFVSFLFRELRNALSTGKSITYVHATPWDVLSEAFKKLVVRIIGLFGWFILFRVLISQIMPFNLTAGHLIAHHLTLNTVGNEFLAFLFLVLDLNLQTVSLRLFFLKRRVFGNESY